MIACRIPPFDQEGTMSPESCDGGEGLRREERASHFCDVTSACRTMSYLGQVELGGYIAWDGREHSMTITDAMGIARVRPLRPTSPAPLRPRTLAPITPLCPSHERDAGQAPCPLMDPGPP